MKNKKKVIIFVLIIVIILVIIFGSNFFSSNVEMVEEIDIENSEEGSELELFQDTSKIRGQGTLTSFNIEELDTGMWTKIDEVFVDNEQMVEANQKILKASNKEAYGNIYSTISGKFFIEENTSANKYFIYDLNNVGLEIEVEENDSVKLKLGQKAEVKFPSISEKFEGRVCYISKIPIEGIVKVKIKLNYSDKLKFGCGADVDILLNEDIDTSIKEYDIKNSFKKIGKTKITLKNQQNVLDQMDFNGMIPGMDELGNLEDEFTGEFEYDVDEISKYYSDLWEEYWNSYWKAYYEEYQSFEVVEPADKSDIPVNDINKQEDIEGE